MSLLPIHGFVLAGGKSSRMGRDKALLELGGRPLIEIALAKLRSFCVDVSIAGNRDDLSGFGEVVCEERIGAGPGAGVEAGLAACRQEWALFIPVDVPLIPAALLRRYAEVAMERATAASHLAATYVGVDVGVDTKEPKALLPSPQVGGPVTIRTVAQPAFCMLHSTLSQPFSAALGKGERRLSSLLPQAAEAACGVHATYDLFRLYGYPDYKGPDAATVERFFLNVNAPEDLARAAHWATGLTAHNPAGLTSPITKEGR